jgi:nucleotide-binding universal stress UspA family protein
LLIVFGIYVFLGLTRPEGFSQDIFMSGRVLFEDKSFFANLARILTTIALIYNAYVGFEVIADDAEEIKKPNRNIPVGILVSLGVTTLVYSLVSFVTIGVIPYSSLSGSETALTDAARIFWPRLGIPLMGAAGIVATLTSVNSAMLSATREAFTLSREGVWPRHLARLSRWRTPYVSIMFVVLISALVTLIGLVDFLSFISSAGYMFVLFWASLAMVKLRKKYPDVYRPFKVPLFPLTAVLAAGSGLLIILFADQKALLFLGLVLLSLSIVYLVSKYFKRRTMVQMKLEEELGGGRLLLAVINPNTAIGLVELAARLAEYQEDTSISLLSVIKMSNLPTDQALSEIIKRSKLERRDLLSITAPIAQKRNVAIATKSKVASNVESAIYKELQSPNPVRMLFLGWPSLETKLKIPHNIIKEVMVNARKDVVVFRNRGINGLKKVLLPIAGGPNTRLMLRLSMALAYDPMVRVTVLHLTPKGLDDEALEDSHLFIQEIVESELGSVPSWMSLKVVPAESVSEGILSETKSDKYDLMMIGVGNEVFSHRYLFGALDDALIEEVDCSMLIVRRYQPEMSLWFRNQIRTLEVVS